MLVDNPKAEKGEYCLVLDMSGVTIGEEKPAVQASPEAQIVEALMQGCDWREAGERLSAQGMKRNDIYRARLALDNLLNGDEEE